MSYPLLFITGLSFALISKVNVTKIQKALIRKERASTSSLICFMVVVVSQKYLLHVFLCGNPGAVFRYGEMKLNHF